jgi:hypothetical protein
MLWKRSGEKWLNEELVPIREASYSATQNAVTISFKKAIINNAITLKVAW